MERRIVMADVAKLAGVSSQTVSRVLSGKDPVRPETEERVRDAIKRLGYKPHTAAQILASGTSRSIGVLTIGQLSYGRMQAFSAFERVARSHGFFVMPASTTSYELSALVDAVHYFLQAQVRSILIIGQRLDLIQALVPHINVPLVIANNADPNLDEISVVRIDQTKSTTKLLEHMSGVGAENIAFLGPSTTDVDAMLRREAYLAFCEKEGTDPHLVETSGWGAADGANAAKELLKGMAFDGIFAANDHIAIGCSAYLKEQAQLRPGLDYALAGFDDIETAAYQYPGLTTVRQEFIAYADSIFDVMQELVETQRTRVQTLSAELVVRDSTNWFANP